MGFDTGHGQSPPNVSIEAEQALLGAILLNNSAYDLAAPIITADHFYDALHGRIFHAIGEKLAQGGEAKPATLQPWLQGDKDLDAAGGPKYLGRLASSVVTVINAPDYAKTIRGCYVRRQIIAACQETINEARFGEIGEDADACLIRHVDTVHQLLDDEAPSRITMAQAADEAYALVVRSRETDGAALYLKTGLIDVDRWFGGLAKSELIILAGRPGQGKTAAAASLALNVAKAGEPVLIFTREMRAAQIALRMICAEGNVDSQKARMGQLSDEDMAALDAGRKALSRLPIEFDEVSGTVPAITAAARAAHRRGKCALLIIDYLGLLDPGTRYRGSPVYEIGQMTRGLKLLANAIGIPVLLLVQLSRDVEKRENKRPVITDLRDSGFIEQDAGTIIFLYRDEYYLEKEKPDGSDAGAMADWHAAMEKVRGKAEWIVAKDRHGPAPWTIELAFDARLTRFSNLARRGYEAAA